ncbi:MAG: hypothetical protein WCI05_15990, partial [Myxococcales bacterium]
IQQNASAAEEMAATTESLSGEAAQLLATVGFFKVGENESRTAMAPRAQHATSSKTEPRMARTPATKTKVLPSRSTSRKETGIHLDLSSSSDQLDDSFEKY